MSVILNKTLPAYDLLLKSGYPVSKSSKYLDNVLNIGVLNLMPVKMSTESHLASVLANNEQNVKIHWFMIEMRESLNTPYEHLSKFYQILNRKKLEKLDGVIITGAPVEKLDYRSVYYWNKLTKIFDWIRELDIVTLHICWAAQAALYHYYNIPKRLFNTKKLGLFDRHKENNSHIIDNLPDSISVPVARNSYILSNDIYAQKDDLKILMKTRLYNQFSDEKVNDYNLDEVYLIEDKNIKTYYAFDHLEYSPDTIAQEYFREINSGLEVSMPNNYFVDNDVSKLPEHFWHKYGRKFYANWLDICFSSKLIYL